MQKLKINEILIPSPLSDEYTGSSPFNSLSDIKRLNVFIGPNNTGKSRFMRELFWTNRFLNVSTSDPILSEILRDSKQAINELKAIENRDVLQRQIYESLLEPFAFQRLTERLSVDQNKLKQIEKDLRNSPAPINHSDYRLIVKELLRKLQDIQSSSAGIEHLKHTFGDAKFVYIPTLRGMRLGDAQNDLSNAYFDRTWRDYNKGRKQNISFGELDYEEARKRHHGKEIQTGLNLYEWVTSRLLGSLADRRFIREFEQYLSSSFFQGETVALIPRRDSDHDTLNIKVGSEEEKPIQFLGDGLQQIIILTLPIFEHKDKPLFLFIEEPELFLHPGFQRAFINSVLESPNEHLYVFVTTHSNHFVDITLQDSKCSIYLFQKNSTNASSDAEESASDNKEVNPKFTISNLSLGDFEILNHLGVKPSSIFFSNCTIWVEGITDRLYFRKYLKIILDKHRKHLLENLHYSFVEYGGGNITHWSFLDQDGPNVDRLCSKLLLISDSDIGKDSRHARLKESLGDRFIRLPVSEVENLLTPNVIEQVIQAYEGDAIELNSFSSDDYREKKLGTFIEENVFTSIGTSKRRSKNSHPYAETSGTIKGKLDFCNKAVAFIKTEKDMSEVAIDIAEKIYAFVLKQNQ